MATSTLIAPLFAPSAIPAGFSNAVLAQGVGLFIQPDGWLVVDAPGSADGSGVTIVNSLAQTYPNSAQHLSFVKNLKQAELDAFAGSHFGLINFVVDGTITNTTGTQVGNFLSSGTNNYRTIRNNISNAPDVATVNAINVKNGWPANP